MRQSTMAFLGLVLLACAKPEAPAPVGLAEADVNAIRAQSEAFQKSIRESNWTGFADFYTSSTQLMPPNGPTVTDHPGLVAWGKAFPPITTFTLKQVTVDGQGDLAFVHGRYNLVMQPPGAPTMPDSGKYIEIWRKQPDGGWKITHDMFNSDIPLPTPPALAK
jgi:ketosteroid isomerase-like protein